MNLNNLNPTKAQVGVKRIDASGESLDVTLMRGVAVSDWNGQNGVEVVENGICFDVDSPMFFPDGEHAYFTPSLAGRKLSWLDWLFGVRTAYAHANANVPVAWMRVWVGR